MLEERRSRADAAPDGAASGAELPEATEVDDGVRDRSPSVWRDGATWAIASVVGGAYLVLSLYRLAQLNPSSWDLGIYTEYVKQLSMLHAPIVDVRGPGFDLLGDHLQVIVALIAPFFRVFPSPATLLVAQALLTAVSVFPVVDAGTALLGRGKGRAIGFAYGFSWGLQQMINFDFHEIAFAVPLLAFSLSALVRGRVRPTVGWALPLVFVKEDQGFTVAAIGALMWLADVRAGVAAGVAAGGAERRRLAGSAWAGAFLVCWGLGWSFVEIGMIIPHFSATHRYAYWNLGGVLGPGSPFSVSGLLGQVGHAYSEKLQTIVMLLVPTAFIALGSPVALIAVPSLLLRFISTNDSYWGTLFHYNATLMPILFLAAIDAMARWRAAADGLSGSDEERGAGARTLPAEGVPPSNPQAAHSAPPGERGWGGARQWSGRAGSMARWQREGEEIEAGGAVREIGEKWLALRGAAVRHGAAMMAAIAVALAFQFPLANLWNGQTYEIAPHVAAERAAMAVVPDGATVTTTLNLLAPLAARCDTYWVGNNGNPHTQYVVFDGPDSGYTPAVTNVPQFVQQQLYPRAGYQIIFSDDGVFVFKLG